MIKVKKEVRNESSLQDLLAAGAHFGHQAGRWHPKMKPYLYGVQGGVHVFDLVKTKAGLDAAKAVVREIIAVGGNVVFIGTKRQAASIIVEESKRASVPYVSERWLGGTLTNWGEMRKRIIKLGDMKIAREKGEYKKYTKKEQLMIDREVIGLEKFLGGLENLKKLPEAIFVVDVRKEEIAIREAKARNIKVIGLVDSNSNPDGIDYVIPANDDAVGAVKLIVEELANSALEGKEIWDKKQLEIKKAEEKEEKKK